MLSAGTQLGVSRVAVQTPTASYDVVIGSGLLADVGNRLDSLLAGKLRSGATRLFIITSPGIDALWGEALRRGLPHPVETLLIAPGEAEKRMATVDRLAEELAGLGADRDSVLLALGGGVVGDMVGFLAAIYMRGIRYVQLPTTLLAQVDSSIGGKTGANLRAGKNLVGAFHHPLAVFADIDTLSTLPAPELRAGLQEAIKAGIIRDPGLFELLANRREAILAGDPEALAEVVTRSVRVKAEVVGADEREGGLRMILNLGHTLGHAIEAVTNYTQLLHGEAVAWGMLAALHIARQRGVLGAQESERMDQVICLYGPLPPFQAAAQDLVARTARDKKNRGGTRSFVLPTCLGAAVVVTDVSVRELLEAAEQICLRARAAGQPTVNA